MSFGNPIQEEPPELGQAVDRLRIKALTDPKADGKLKLAATLPKVDGDLLDKAAKATAASRKTKRGSH